MLLAEYLLEVSLLAQHHTEMHHQERIRASRTTPTTC